MRDPDVIVRVDGDAGNRAENPSVGQRFGPDWIDAESRNLSRRDLDLSHGSGDRRDEQESPESEVRPPKGHAEYYRGPAVGRSR